jgi:hypothetical protein
MVTNADPWITRAESVLQAGVRSAEIVPFAISFVSAIYGAQSIQSTSLQSTLAQISKNADSVGVAFLHQNQHARGTIQNTIAEIKGGLISTLRVRIAGEVLAELVGLGKEIMDNDTPAANNVSAVLIAAAYEDLIRSMGTELAGITGRPKLEEVVNRLKDAGVLVGGEVATAQSYLKFRNDSLHADWTKVQRPVTQSCLAFIEGLLTKHFS